MAQGVEGTRLETEGRENREPRTLERVGSGGQQASNRMELGARSRQASPKRIRRSSSDNGREGRHVLGRAGRERVRRLAGRTADPGGPVRRLSRNCAAKRVLSRNVGGEPRRPKRRSGGKERRRLAPRQKKEALGTASRPEGFSFVGRSFAVLGFPPDFRLALRLTFLQAANSASLFTQFRVIAILSPPSSGGFDRDQRLLHRRTELQILGPLPPLRRPARWNTFRESYKGMTNAIESTNHIGNAPRVWCPRGAESSLGAKNDRVSFIKLYLVILYTFMRFI